MLIHFIAFVIFYLAWPWVIVGAEVGELPYFLEAYRWLGHPDAPQGFLAISVMVSLLGGLYSARRYGGALALLILMMDAALIGGLVVAWPYLLGRGFSQQVALVACYMVWVSALMAPVRAIKWWRISAKFRSQCEGDIFARPRQRGYSPAWFFVLLAAGAAGLVYAFSQMLGPAMAGSALGLMSCATALGAFGLLLGAGEMSSRPILIGRAGVLYSTAMWPWAKAKSWGASKSHPRRVVIHWHGLASPDKVEFTLSEEELAQFKEKAAPLIAEARRAREERRAARKFARRKEPTSRAPTDLELKELDDMMNDGVGEPAWIRSPRRKPADDFTIKPAASTGPAKQYNDGVL